jgi:hypothetical protein
MATLTAANRQWSSRPDDERFLSLTDMEQHFRDLRYNSASKVVSSRQIEAVPVDAKSLAIVGPNGNAAAPTHWSFGQLAQLAGAPAGYLRGLPAPIAADCINYGLKFDRDIEDVGLLLTRTGDENAPLTVRAATGPRYGRVWNSDVVGALVDRFGDGVTGDWRVPGEFGRRVHVTKANTTLFAGDRDMFVFLADEERRIELPNRRNGKAGSLARGAFFWNSEVGGGTLGCATFLFDYVCSNRIVWGAAEYKEIRLRHTAGAPDKWLEQVRPAIQRYAEGSANTVTQAIEDARAHRLDGEELDSFLAERFGARSVAALKAVHEAEENRPIESRWDVVVAATAQARNIPWQDERVALERKAGDLLR